MAVSTLFDPALDLTSAKERLPHYLYTAEKTRELDRCAIDQHGIPGITLMKRAGNVAYEQLMRCWSQTKSILVFCGSGNNAGDGYEVARLAHADGLEVSIVQVGDSSKLKDDALAIYEECIQLQIPKISLASYLESSKGLVADVIVDGLLGTGINTGICGDYKQAVIAINSSDIPCLSLDIPSGLCADTGVVLGAAIEAACTVTFITCKQGLLTGEGPAHTGELIFQDLDVPKDIYQKTSSAVTRVSLNAVKKLLPPRKRTIHKGMCGHVLIVGGDYGMVGAVAMAAEAAARCGAGLVSVATHQEHCAVVVGRCPEVMCHSVECSTELEPLLDKADVIVVGPGLGMSFWSEELLNAAILSSSSLVLDADGLNLLSGGKLKGYGQQAKNNNWILTPHPGEAARLLGVDNEAVQEDRFKAVKALQNLYGGAIVLKGAGTLICSGDEQGISLAAVGNPGMASGGMGDVLSGIIGGLLGQGLSLAEAARVGPYVHGLAADMAASIDGERGLLATDLIRPLRHIINW